MLDETIAPLRYRTGRSDRSIPLLVGLLLVAAAPVLAWFSGPYLWPWGSVMASAALLGGLGALRRWGSAGVSVVWDQGAATLEFRSLRRVTIPWASLTKVEVRPSSVRTLLWVGRKRYSLSHRLIRAEALLESLRNQRPDLFPVSAGPVTLRRSSASAVLQVGLAAGTAAAGAILWPWQWGLGVFFGTAAFYVLLRILFFIPRSYAITEGAILTRYWLRVRRWGRPQRVREEGYAAGGAVFFRMVLDYGPWKVVLDEGQLLDPLRPRAGWIFHLLLPPVVR